jgi:Domain of unknown function (DUF4340)
MGKLLAKILRFLYRLVVKNRPFRIFLSVCFLLFATFKVSEGCLKRRDTVLTAILVAVPPAKVKTFTIRQSTGDELIFVRQNQDWIAVKNNVSAKIATKDIQPYLNIFRSLESLRSVGADWVRNTHETAPIMVQIAVDSSAPQTFYVQKLEKEAATGNLFTIVSLPGERVAHYVKGNLMGLLDKSFNELRNTTIFNFEARDIQRVECSMNKKIVYKFLRNKNQIWESVNEEYEVLQPIFNQYLTEMGHTAGTHFYENITFDVTNYIDNQLIVYVKDSLKYTLTTYKYADQYLLQSTQNQHAFFKMDSANVFFPDPKTFLRKKGVEIVVPPAPVTAPIQNLN